MHDACIHIYIYNVQYRIHVYTITCALGPSAWNAQVGASTYIRKYSYLYIYIYVYVIKISYSVVVYSRPMVLKWMTKFSSMPEVYQAKCVFWDPITSQQFSDTVNFMLPFEVLGNIAGAIGPETMTEFQANQTDLKATLTEWCNRMGAPLNKTVPVGLWADSAPYNTRDSIYLFLFHFLTGPFRSRFWFCCIPKRVVCACGCSGRHTFQGAWDVLVWCFEALLTGVMPSVRHDGIPFAESKFKGDQERAARARTQEKFPLRAGVIRKRGDWDWLKQGLGLQGWRDGKRVCWKCDCTKDCMRDFGPRAQWKESFFSHTSFLTDMYMTNRFVMPLLRLPGFMIDYVLPDLMHCGDLGVILYALGNTAWELFKKMGGVYHRPDGVLGNLMAMIDCTRKLHHIPKPFNKLTIGMVRPQSKKPKLKVKAAEARYALKVFRHMLPKFFPAESPREKLREDMIEALAMAYDVMDPEYWDDESSPLELSRWGHRHLSLYHDLSHDALINLCIYGTFWNIYPKHHLCCHIFGESQTNPRDEWNYEDESEIGKCSQAAELLHPKTLHRSLIERHRV